MNITITVLSDNGKRINVVIENAGSFDYKGHTHEIAIRVSAKTRVAEGRELVAFLNMSKDKDCLYIPKVAGINVITFDDATCTEPDPNAGARIPSEKPEDAVKAESIKESEVEKASDSDIDEEYKQFGFKSQKEFDEYIEEGQRLADEFESVEDKENEDIDRIIARFGIDDKCGDVRWLIKYTIECYVDILNRCYEKKQYWEDAVDFILKRLNWNTILWHIKTWYPAFYLDLVKVKFIDKR